MHRSYGLQHLRHKQPTRRNRGLPSLVHSAASCCWRNFLFRHAFIYIHFPVLCEPPLYQQREKSGEAAAISFIPTVPHCVFQLLAQTAHVRFHSRKRVHTRLSEKDRTQGHTRRNRGVSDRGVVSLPSTRTARSRTFSGRVSERRTLPLLGFGLVCSRRTQRACGTAMHLCASLSRGVAAPLGCVIFFCFCQNCGLHTMCSVLSACARRGVVSPLSACSTCRRNARCPLVKAANSPFPCLARFFFDSSSAKCCPLSLQMPKGPAGYPLVLSLLFASPYLP